VLYTDAVNMKGMSAAFDHDDVYIESFLAGHDIILFVHNDYIDVMEKAYNAGRITMEQIDERVTRVLDLKENLGLFDAPLSLEPLTDEENADFENVLYELAKSAQTLVTNHNGAIPFDPKKVKKAAILTL
jgi:beta-glucosidase-like glycosyl hydrolase